ncbi:MAG: hypothetical protein PHX87_05510 [Candidatus Peribacteraceae bacterium]|nr:hypothetical protein [Candidatus Peribacteraceae bacterium]MDD5742850.1 hypothetical protein [Candidatus Peribacteraceae bacterium]
MSNEECQDDVPAEQSRFRLQQRDPQAIEEDPDVANDPMIVRIREMLGSGEPLSHLLKGRED